MRTFRGSDNRFYKNELCLDDTNGQTIALRDLKKLKMNKAEINLINQWKNVFNNAKDVKKTKERKGITHL